MANNSQRGTNERIREKMLKISERATAVSGDRDRADTHQLQGVTRVDYLESQANVRTLREGMEECEVTMREKRERAQEAERASERLREVEQQTAARIQESERR